MIVGRGVAAETQHQRGSRRGRHIQAAHRPDDDAVLASGALDGHVRQARAREGNEMHSLVRRGDRQVVAEAALEGGDQFVALIPVQQRACDGYALRNALAP